jgi:hypothetical protein
VTAAPLADIASLEAEDVAELRLQYDPWYWARYRANVQLPKTGPLELESHPFLRDVFRDTHPEIVVIKGAQMGFSTTALIRTFWFATTFPVTAMYTFPSGSDVTKFTQSRINPLISGTPYLRKRIVDVNSVTIKQFRVMHESEMERWLALPSHKRPAWSGQRSTLYFSGASTEKDAATVDADLVVHDEEDLADPQIIEQFESRLDASKFKWRFRLSTPRIPGAGIDRVWKTTDMRKWFVRCSRCNSEFEMAFPGGPWDYSCIEPVSVAEFERMGKARYVCPRCKGTLSDADRAAGRWIATAPGPASRAHGYQVSQMAAPWVTAERVLQRRSRATWESDFWNLVMGIPWEEGTNAMTRDALLGRQDTTRAMQQTAVGGFMGVDVGAKLDVIVDVMEEGRPRTVHMGRYDSFDEMDGLMARFDVRTCVVDAAPDSHLTRQFADRYNDYESGRIRVWRVTYGGGPKGPQVVWNEKTGDVTAPRTEILSKSADELLAERVLPRYDGSEAYEAFLVHHWNSKKVPQFVEGLESQGVLAGYKWVEVGPDHLFHAATYAMLARMAPRDQAPPMIGLVSLRRRPQGSNVEAPVYRPASVRPPSR